MLSLGFLIIHLKIVGLAHLAYSDSSYPSITAEFGVSVSESGRGIGIGTGLFKRSAMHCRNTHIEILYVHCLSSNDAMMHIAKKAGMRVENVDGETDAYLRLPLAIRTQYLQKLYKNR
jgi:RimJ/RimL family protein N-acetyltransferase